MKPSANPVHGRDAFHRRRNQRARRTDMVSALYDAALETAEGLAKRAERAGAPVIAVTVDVLSPATRGTYTRLQRTDTSECGRCHAVRSYLSRKPNFAGIDLGGITTLVRQDRVEELALNLADDESPETDYES